MLENGQEKCTCKKKDCERHGKCKECLEFHRLHKRFDPYCKRKGRVTKASREKTVKND